MSASSRNHFRKFRKNAPLFAALGDRTRLSLLIRLGDGSLLSITSLTRGTRMSRQAVTKHLRVLEDAGLVRSSEHGRERLYQIHPEQLNDARDTLDAISRQWDKALARLKAFVEE